jgi:prevent-host-death family protein
MKQYPIAEARNQFAAIVHAVENGEPVEVTRRGEVVAVVLSADGYRRLSGQRTSFWDEYERFRQQVDLSGLDIDPTIFASARDRDPGREVAL